MMQGTDIETILKKDGVFVSTTSGVSMFPMLRDRRDTIIVTKRDGRLQKYDVALYKRGDSYVLHRVIKVLEDEYLIRGDNTYAIEHIPKDMVIGVLVEFNRKGKRQKCTDKSYMAYSRFWNFIYPIRFVLYHTCRFLGRIYRKLKSLFKPKAKEQNKEQ